MTSPRVHRYVDRADLASHVAGDLARHLAALQREQDVVNLCICGGATANAILSWFGPQVEESGLDPERMELWWSDDHFVPTGDPERNSTQALSRLARSFHLSTARTHSMPTPVGVADVRSGALTYAEELGETDFDVALLSLGHEGRIAELEPGSAGLATSSLTIGVEAPDDGDDLPHITLTPAALNRSAQVWFVASGADRADALANAIAMRPETPASYVRGRTATRWAVDDAAAEQLTTFRCRW